MIEFWKIKYLSKLLGYFAIKTSLSATFPFELLQVIFSAKLNFGEFQKKKIGILTIYSRLGGFDKKKVFGIN